MSSDSAPLLQPISRARFDAFAGYCRSPLVIHLAHELAWFEGQGGDLLATLVVDTDMEFTGVLLARDLHQRFRWVDQTSYFQTPTEAAEALSALVAATDDRLSTDRVQGDEVGRPVDFFAPLAEDDRLHPTFKHLVEDSAIGAAKGLIEVMMRWYEDRDGNFIQQFQTTGFDARLWELYLWATLVSLNYRVEFPVPAPDLIASGIGVRFTIEATTVNPTVVDGRDVPTPNPASTKEYADYFRNYLPIRFAGPLTAKLAQRYWKHSSVGGIPLVLAVQDFHDEFSMTFSGPSLASYLYGVDLTANGESPGSDPPPAVERHTWLTKTVPSGFFFLPDAENISAVLFNASGTLSKFNRMGIKVGLGLPTVRVIHAGERVVSTDEVLSVTTFGEEVSEGYAEDWIDGMEVFHNPRAVRPLDPDWLPGAAHHRFTEGRVESYMPAGHLLRSRMAIVTATDTSGFPAS